MKKILLLLLLFFSLFLSACTDNEDVLNEDKTFTEQLQDCVTAFEIEITNQNYDLYKIPSIGFPYRDTMTPSSLKSTLIEDYNTTNKNTFSDIPYLLNEVLELDEVAVVENEPIQVGRKYNDITTKYYTFSYQANDGVFDFQIYTEQVFNDDRDYFSRQEFHGLISDEDGMLKMEFEYRLISGSEESLSIYHTTGVVYENGKSYGISTNSIVENNEVTNTITNSSYADLITNTRYTVITNQLKETVRYEYGSAANDVYLYLTLTNSDITEFEARFYKDYFPAFTLKYNNPSSTMIYDSSSNTMIYNLAYIDGWTEYLYDNNTYLIKENDNILLGDNTGYVLSSIGGFINISRNSLVFDIEDMELNVEGLTMPSLNWIEVKDTISNLNEQYFLNLSTQFLDPSQTENIDLILNSPYE